MAWFNTKVKDWRVGLRNVGEFNKGSRKFGYRTLQQGTMSFNRKKKNGCRLASSNEIAKSQAAAPTPPAVSAEYAMTRKVLVERRAAATPVAKPERKSEIAYPQIQGGNQQGKTLGIFLHCTIRQIADTVTIGETSRDTSKSWSTELDCEGMSIAEIKTAVMNALTLKFRNTIKDKRVVWYV